MKRRSLIYFTKTKQKTALKLFKKKQMFEALNIFTSGNITS